MRRLSAGLVSWLTFQQVARREEMYSERFVYTPIFELASARGWRVDHEYRVRLDGETVSRRIDFVFSRGGKTDEIGCKVAALEIKYVSKHDNLKTREVRNILLDKKKLENFDDSQFHSGRHAPVDRYVMLIGKQKSLEALCRKARDVREAGVGHLMRRVETVLNSEEGKHDETQPFGEIFFSPFNYKALWCVVILFLPAKQREV